MMDLRGILQSGGDSVLIRVKVVPGASRSKVVGLLGEDRLKIAVAAPPEGGKANKAVCALLANVLGAAIRDVGIVQGQTQPMKTVEIVGGNICDITAKLAGALGGGD